MKGFVRLTVFPSIYLSVRLSEMIKSLSGKTSVLDASCLLWGRGALPTILPHLLQENINILKSSHLHLFAVRKDNYFLCTVF